MTFETVFQELRYAGRTLWRRSPGYAVTATLTLALAIGASTAVFTIVDSVLLKPLAFEDSGRLVACWERVASMRDDATGPNPLHVDVWRQRAGAFRGLTFLRHTAMGFEVASNGQQHPRMTSTVIAAANLFDVLQVHAQIGRTFVPEDGTPGHDGVAVLTDAAWREQFQGDPDVIGKTIRLGDVPRQIVGVLPAGFHFPSGSVLRAFRSGGGQTLTGAQDPSVFIPVALDLNQMSWSGNYGNWVTLGRLKPGVDIAQATAELNGVQAQILADPRYHGERSPGSLGASVQLLQDAVVADSRLALWMLMASVTGLLLIACLNLANANLGRALTRGREAAVRAALGAARWRLVWNALAESLLLAVAGGAAGVGLAWAGLGWLLRATPAGLPRVSEIHLNPAVLGFAIAVTFGASLVSGLLPALRMAGADPQGALQQSGGSSGSRSIGSRHGNGVRQGLIGLQVAGCTALLLVTGLFSKSLLHLLGQERGFDTSRVAVAEVRLTPQSYGKDQSRVSFVDGVLENLRGIGGVESAAMVSAMPLDGESWIEAVERVDKPNLETPLINFRWVSPGYFEVMRQRLVAGRFLEERDRNLSSAVLSEGEARALWGNDDPIGGQVRIEGRTFTVVGIVADSRSTSLKTAPARMAYVHLKDRPPYPTYFVVRTAAGGGNAGSLTAAMREAIWKYDPGVTIARVKTLDAQLTDSLAVERFETEVLLSFGAAALALAMLGIYGVLNCSVAARKQEIGLRMALGSTRGGVYGLAFGEAYVPVFGGVCAGLIASLAASRAIEKLLYGTHGVDWAVIAAVAGVLVLAAGVAGFLPARQAASVDPMEALRSD